ncbi:MAG TPA: hypothetical protein VH105_13815 [Burkholderiales bacterium]|nr:hypothetical protein [Burkholderiales bacterium]
MDGMNEEFKKDPKGFLQKRVIMESMKMGAHPPVGKLVDFDLKLRVSDGTGVEIIDFNTREKQGAVNDTRISAYWLPWKVGGAPSLRLSDTGVSYFFTSQVAGCQIRIVPATGSEKGPLVMHIDGGLADRDGKAKEGMGDAAFARSRALTRSGPDGYGENADGVNVVGFRNSTGAWEIWAQSTDQMEMTVQGLRQLL